MEFLTSGKLNNEIKEIELKAWGEAEELYLQGKNTSLFHLFFFPLFSFLHLFLFKGAIFRGIPGLTDAALRAYQTFQRYAKLILLKKEMK